MYRKFWVRDLLHTWRPQGPTYWPQQGPTQWPQGPTTSRATWCNTGHVAHDFVGGYATISFQFADSLVFAYPPTIPL